MVIANIKKIQELLLPYKIGFIRGHSYLNDLQISQIRQVLDSSNDQATISDYEQRLAALISLGQGSC